MENSDRSSGGILFNNMHSNFDRRDRRIKGRVTTNPKHQPILVFEATTTLPQVKSKAKGGQLGGNGDPSLTGPRITFSIEI